MNKMSNIDSSERSVDNLDSIVKSVINSFIERSRFGLQKYGTDLDRTDLDFLDWVKHAQEEHMDAILYLEKLKQMHISRGECNEGEFNVLAKTESESKLNLSERSVDELKVFAGAKRR